MRRRKRPESAVLEDRYAAIRADHERGATEVADLKREVEEREEQRALARHLGRGDADKIEAKLHKTERRLAELEPELGDLRRALSVLAADVTRARRIEAVDRKIEAADREQKAAVEVEKAETALVRARARHEQETAAVLAAEQDAERIEAEAAAVAAAIESGAADPLAEAARARSKREQAAWKQDNEKIGWAERAILSGSPTSAVLGQIPARLHPEVEARVQARRSPQAQKEQRRREIENAKAKGEGLILNGEMIVQPKREPVPAIELLD